VQVYYASKAVKKAQRNQHSDYTMCFMTLHKYLTHKCSFENELLPVTAVQQRQNVDAVERGTILAD